MGRFTDGIKVAKFLSLYLRKDEIDIECMEMAMCFLAENAVLESAILSVKPDFAIPAERCAYGQYLVAAYQPEPKVLLDKAASDLRRKIERSPANDIPTAYPVVLIAEIEAKFLELLKHIKTADLYLERNTLQKERAEAEKFYETIETEIALASILVKSAKVPASSICTEPAAAAIPSAAAGAYALIALRERLQAQLLDQSLAINELCEGLLMREWGLVPIDRPAIFVLAGPPSCGKTMMTGLLAQAFPERPILTLNMASFAGRQEGSGLTGLRRGYESAGAGQLTGFVHEYPNAIVALDNFDRAHPVVQTLLISLFADGTLADEYGFGESTKGNRQTHSLVSFKNAIVLLTTNIGSRIYDRSDYWRIYENEPEKAKALIREELSRAEISKANVESGSADDLNSSHNVLGSYLGITQVLPFRALGLPALLAIAQRSILAFQERLLRSQQIVVRVAEMDKLALALTLGLGPEINAKEVEGAATRAILKAYMHEAALSLDKPITSLIISVCDDKGILQTLSQLPPAKVLSDFFRRSEVISYELRPIRSGNELQLDLRNVAILRVPVASDYGGDGGFTVEIPSQKFEDVFGHVHIKQRLAEVIRLLKAAKGDKDNAISLPRGMLLFGRPGTGKTMLAKALAAEADLPFIAVTGPQLLNIALIKAMFKRARKFAPCLVFIDEIDALGVRGHGGYDVCINQLLTEIDGFVESRDGNVFVIAATNFPQKVDSALTRSGRLDLRLEVPMLDREARQHFIDRLKRLPGGEDWNSALLIELSAGMSGADLEKLCRESQLDLIRRPRKTITEAEILEQLNVIKHGARVENPPLRERMIATAYHEAGHAIVSMALNPDVRIEQVTIVPRGDALGFTAYTEESLTNRQFNRHETMDLICVSLAGRVAQSKQFPASVAWGGDDAGASSDLARATSLAWRAITTWGLDETFGWAASDALGDQAPANWQNHAGERVNAWLDEAKKITSQTVNANWDKIDKLAGYLLEHEMIDGDNLRKLAKLEMGVP